MAFEVLRYFGFRAILVNLVVADVSVFGCAVIDFIWKSQYNLLDIVLRGQI